MTDLTNNGSPARRSQTEELEEEPQERLVEIDDLADPVHAEPLQLGVHRHDDFDHHIIAGSPNDTWHSTTAPKASNSKRLEALRLLRGSMPDRLRCDELLGSYLLNVEWIHHPLHVPQFQRQYDVLWDRLSKDDPPDLQWLALLLIVLCLGAHFSSDSQDVRQEEALYAASNELLQLSNHLANHSMTAIQTLILMGLWLNNRGLSNTHHAQLALAIKMAMNLGYNKLDKLTGDWHGFQSDDQAFFTINHYSQPSNIQAADEMKRRLWWSLVCQDYYTSSSCNFTYTIHPSQCKTCPFANLDEEDLPIALHDRMNVPSPSSLATSSSYQLLKIPFARIAKTMTDLYNDDALSYSAILDLEKLLWQMYDQLPTFFKWQSETGTPSMPASLHVDEQHLQWQRLFLGFTVHNRVLRLHRPFMAHGYSDATMVHSRQATIESALACISLAEQGRDIDFPGLRWWVVLIHLFTAAVALCIDYHYLLRFQRERTGGADLSKLVRSRRNHIARATDLLRPAKTSSIAAARAVKTIDSLVMQAERSTTQSPIEIQTRPSKKRRVAESPAVSISADDILSIPPVMPSGVENSIDGNIDFWNNDWLSNDWSGPDWELLFASISDTTSEPGGVNAELYETIHSYANGFENG